MHWIPRISTRWGMLGPTKKHEKALEMVNCQISLRDFRFNFGGYTFRFGFLEVLIGSQAAKACSRAEPRSSIHCRTT